jgi:peroxiredoxin
MRRSRNRWVAIGVFGLLGGCASRSPSLAVTANAATAAPSSTPRNAPPSTAPSAAAPDAPPPVAQEAASAEPTDAPPASDAADTRGWLGVELEATVPERTGVRIGRVVPKSPADRAGLLAGDVITNIDAKSVAVPDDVIALVSQSHAGARLGVALKRNDAARLIAVTLGALPEREEIYRMSFLDQPAPAFEDLLAATGTFTPTLAAQKGQVLVVEFWAPWCVACRALIPHMNDWQARYAPRGLRVIGITASPVTEASEAAAQLGMTYPVAADESGKTTMAYQARAIPAVFVIDRRGTVRDVMVGYDAMRLPKLDALVERLIAER